MHTCKPNTPFLCIETKKKGPYPIKRKIKCQLLGKQRVSGDKVSRDFCRNKLHHLLKDNLISDKNEV